MGYRIIVAGIGPGNPKYVLPAAAEVIKNADVLVGGSRALADFAGNGQKTMAIRGDIPAVMSFIRENLESSDVVVMVSGDPGYYSLLDALRREFPEDVLEVIPGISSVQYAFSKLALPWHDALLLSFHGRVPDDASLRYEKGKLLGLLTDAKYSSKTIPEVLIKHGWPKDARLAICSRLSYEDEEIVRTTLGEAADEKEQTHCILVVEG
ncbi:MAG: precorrin-6y C5,15-methyltransferase (decarboxylating) subunit CbiE [Schwartzia sp.]|nr:precorrin-6y C5,15-methyltransferase (decarboxylating) subunit CbiE [Schwartzia sp. (in: firmicutes)]MBQ1918983.1 precorrin-6y C5,15-methyltransferase (decarboxylating) subunit CbiE [Schwartzia sp. (in: firmicutes)]